MSRKHPNSPGTCAQNTSNVWSAAWLKSPAWNTAATRSLATRDSPGLNALVEYFLLGEIPSDFLQNSLRVCAKCQQSFRELTPRRGTAAKIPNGAFFCIALRRSLVSLLHVGMQVCCSRGFWNQIRKLELELNFLRSINHERFHVALKLKLNPFTPKTDQFQISPAASPAILHHIVWRTWRFRAYIQMKDDSTTNSHYLTYTILFKSLGE